MKKITRIFASLMVLIMAVGIAPAKNALGAQDKYFAVYGDKRVELRAAVKDGLAYFHVADFAKAIGAYAEILVGQTVEAQIVIPAGICKEGYDYGSVEIVHFYDNKKAYTVAVMTDNAKLRLYDEVSKLMDVTPISREVSWGKADLYVPMKYLAEAVNAKAVWSRDSSGQVYTLTVTPYVATYEGETYKRVEYKETPVPAPTSVPSTPSTPAPVSTPTPTPQVTPNPRKASIKATFGKVKFTLNEKPLEVNGLLVDKTPYIPVTYLANIFGLETTWEGKISTTSINYASKPIKAPAAETLAAKVEEKQVDVVFGSPLYRFNGVYLTVDDVMTYDNKAYMPAVYLATALGGTAKYDEKTAIVAITYKQVEKVTTGKNAIELKVGGVESIKTTVAPTDATVKAMRYTSSDAKVATVDVNGKVKGVSLGNATITCLAANGVAASVKVDVVVPVTRIEVSAARGSGYAMNYYLDSEEVRVKVSVYPENATNKKYVLSCTDKTATIVGDTIKFGKSGKATITATMANGISAKTEVVLINIEEYRNRVVELVNIERAKVGLAALTDDNETLNRAAKMRSAELSTICSHTRPDGSNFRTILDGTGLNPRMAAENLVSARATPEEAMDAWMNSPGHRNNILDKTSTQIGVGVYFEPGTEWGIYWLQIFY